LGVKEKIPRLGKIESKGKGQHNILRLTESGEVLDVSDEIQVAVRLIDFLPLFRGPSWIWPWPSLMQSRAGSPAIWQ
jgi:hypothetical protein